MGAVRSCDARCHNARQAECECWCGGHFHGAAGAPNREIFLSAFKVRQIPATRDEYEQVLQQPRLQLVEGH